MKYFLVAGEASGDLHGSNLMKQLLIEDQAAEFAYWGGDKMSAVVGTPLKHIKELAFMGFAEVVANLRTILGNIDLCKQQIKDAKPDMVILIDYPGFNLKIAEFAKSEGIRVVYYISPQVWAWKKNRVHKIKKFVDQMLVILPFEQAFYKGFDMEVEYVGHPLLDAISDLEGYESFRSRHSLSDQPIIAMLPGSREQELSRMLPVMVEVAGQYPDHQIVLGGAPSLNRSSYQEAVDAGIPVIYGETYQLLANSHAAMVTSGTATLETALFGVPQVVCYKGGFISYSIAKRVVDIEYISLVNLIMEDQVVTELIQAEMNPSRLKEELDKVLSGEGRAQMIATYQQLKLKLGGEGASSRAAGRIVEAARH